MKAKELNHGELFVLTGSRVILEVDKFVAGSILANTFMCEVKVIDGDKEVIRLSKKHNYGGE